LQGLPSDIQSGTFIDNRYPTLIIIDDLMKDATENKLVCKLFTESAHHRNLLVAEFVLQDKESRTMNLNSFYLVLLKKPRDQQQIAILARQMYPSDWRQLVEKYRKTVKA